MNKLWVIGLAGTNGAGKDTVGHMLAEHHNYLFISVTELLRNEARRRGLPVEREVLRNISAEWRRELGLGVLVDKAVAEYEIVREKYAGVVMASLRNPGEADRIHDLGGTMVWIDADPRVRYDRVQAAAAKRNRAGEDNKTFEQFQAEEAVEMQSSSGDVATLNMLAVKERCDIFPNNDNTGLETFRKDIEQALGL
jgi:dephospho-CoA kinase